MDSEDADLAKLPAYIADAQADLSLRCAHSHFVGFVMRQLICNFFHFLIEITTFVVNVVSNCKDHMPRLIHVGLQYIVKYLRS